MRIFHDLEHVPNDARGTVLALGNFDGVHLGHRALIGEVRAIARDVGRPSAAMVFEPSPREFFRPHDPPFRLTNFSVKAQLMEELGLDRLLVLPFDTQVAAMQAPDFVLEILVGKLGVSHVVVGRDFLFGQGRTGDGTMLAYMGEMEEFGVTILTPVRPGEGAEKISSSAIRAMLQAGRPDAAAQLLGRLWSVTGKVVGGDRRGYDLGFPTANMQLEGVLNPAFGVYAVKVRVVGEARAYGGVANFGIRPNFALKEPLLETHIFDFSGDLYGKSLEVAFAGYLRPEMRFAGLSELTAQIARDAAGAHDRLAALALDPPHTP